MKQNVVDRRENRVIKSVEKRGNSSSKWPGIAIVLFGIEVLCHL